MFELAAVGFGAVLAWIGSFLNDRRQSQRDERRLANEAQAARVQRERQVIAELLAALVRCLTAVDNLVLVYDYATDPDEALPDDDRIREQWVQVEGFTDALVRARVSIQNPAARPLLDELHMHQVAVAGRLNAIAQDAPVLDLGARYDELSDASGRILTKLEEAALNWDGALPTQKPLP